MPSCLGHLGIDNLNVVTSIGWLLDCCGLSKPLHQVKDDDVIAIIQHMILARGPDTVKVTKVKEHATEADVDQGRVRHEDRHGNIQADTAADLGRRNQSEEVMYVRCGPRILVSHRSFSFLGSCLLFLGLQSIMMGVLARPLTLLSRIRRVAVSNARLPGAQTRVRLRSMLLKLMWRPGQAGKTGFGILKLMLLLTLGGVISLGRLWMMFVGPA